MFPNLTGPQNVTFNSFYFFCARTNRFEIPFSFLTEFLTLSHLSPIGNSKAQPDLAVHGSTGMQGSWNSLFLAILAVTVTWNHPDPGRPGDGIVSPPVSYTEPVPSTAP